MFMTRATAIRRSKRKCASEIRAVNLPDRTANLFSDAVMVGDTLYLSGRLGLVGGQPPATATEEARIVLDSIQSVLAEAGMTMDDLVQVQVFCSDVSFYGEFNEVHQTYFGDRPPAGPQSWLSMARQRSPIPSPCFAEVAMIQSR